MIDYGYRTIGLSRDTDDYKPTHVRMAALSVIAGSFRRGTTPSAN